MTAPSPVTAPESPLERRLATFIGPRWATYRRKFRPFFDDPAFVPTWNWSAALATEYWFLYRKMYLWFAVFFFVPTVAVQWLWGDAVTLEAVTAPENEQLRLIIIGVQISSRLAAGGIANWLLLRRASTAIRVVDAQPLGEADAEQLLRRLGGTNSLLTWLLVGVFLVLLLLQLGSAATGLTGSR